MTNAPVRVDPAVAHEVAWAYRDAEELIASVTESRTLEITTVAADPDRRHPEMGNEFGGSYDRFRAVHDALGHGRTQLGFDRDGEFAVWRAQERFHSPGKSRWTPKATLSIREDMAPELLVLLEATPVA